MFISKRNSSGSDIKLVEINVSISCFCRCAAAQVEQWFVTRGGCAGELFFIGRVRSPSLTAQVMEEPALPPLLFQLFSSLFFVSWEIKTKPKSARHIFQRRIVFWKDNRVIGSSLFTAGFYCEEDISSLYPFQHGRW